MAIDYKALRNQLDANVNQMGFAQTLANTFLADIFKPVEQQDLTGFDNKPLDMPTTNPTAGSPDIRSGTRTITKLGPNSTVQSVSLSQELIPESVQTFDVPQSHLFNYWFSKLSGPGNGWGTIQNLARPNLTSGALTTNQDFWKKLVPNMAPIYFAPGGSALMKRPIQIDATLGPEPKPVTIRTQAYVKTNANVESADFVNYASLTQNIYRDISGSELPQAVTDPTSKDQSTTSAMKKFFEMAAQRANEIDTNLLEKYVSPTAAKGIKSLLNDLASGIIPADLRARMQRGETFNPRSEALKLILENPQHFAGIRSFGGMVSGFKASEAQSAEKIDQKKILSQTTTGTQFRKALASEISRVINTSAGTKRAGTQFTKDARFDVNSESAILNNLRTDLSSIAVKAGKQGAGLSILLNQIGGALKNASGFTGAIRNLGVGSGETLKSYQSRLTREIEKRTPRTFLDSTSQYAKAGLSSLSSLRVFPELQNTSPFVIGTTPRIGL